MLSQKTEYWMYLLSISCLSVPNFFFILIYGEFENPSCVVECSSCSLVSGN